MSDEPSFTLNLAAVTLGETAGKGTSRPWVAAMPPSVVNPLVDWLLAEARFVRRNFKAMHGQVEHLPSMRFARQILNEETQ